MSKSTDFPLPNLSGRVALVTGASRGIGKAVALRLAQAGADICVAAKSLESKPSLPGSIRETAAEVEALGRRAVAVQTDVRDETQIERMITRCVEELGSVDILVNNAGALWWHDVVATPAKRFDLVMSVNARASFLAAHYALPHMIERGFGHIIVMSPPVDVSHTPHKTAYFISKFGMTLLAHGLAGEVADQNIACNALWPATLVESQATINFGIGERSMWRKPDILADATVAICGFEPRELTGNALLDEEALGLVGITNFDNYACVAGTKPPPMSELTGATTHGRGGNPFARRPDAAPEKEV
jgi:citronellol/citronellal dehydrogenase